MCCAVDLESNQDSPVDFADAAYLVHFWELILVWEFKGRENKRAPQAMHGLGSRVLPLLCLGVSPALHNHTS